MDLWFREVDDGKLSYGYKIKDVLYRGHSDFQAVDVVETEAYGKMLLIDGLVMLTESDEFVYHEMIAHIPALLHSEPRSILVIGGGDGGTVRELLKHSSVEKVTLCEIDGLVVETAKRYFPGTASCLTDNRVDVLVADGVKFVADQDPETFDLVIVDSTDPIGPGEGLFTQGFYRNVAQVLGPGGLMACQSESPWYRAELLNRIHNNVRGGFEFVKPYLGSIPTYPRGLWSWTIGSQRPIEPKNYDRERLAQISDGLSYLNEGVVESSFVLPNFYRRKLQES